MKCAALNIVPVQVVAWFVDPAVGLALPVHTLYKITAFCGILSLSLGSRRAREKFRGWFQ
jgi:hypothetical protein